MLQITERNVLKKRNVWNVIQKSDLKCLLGSSCCRIKQPYLNSLTQQFRKFRHAYILYGKQSINSL